MTTRDRRLVERHKAAIESLEAKLFPFQESEEEQEAFTDVGRLRVAEWLEAQASRYKARPA